MTDGRAAALGEALSSRSWTCVDSAPRARNVSLSSAARCLQLRLQAAEPDGEHEPSRDHDPARAPSEREPEIRRALARQYPKTARPRIRHQAIRATPGRRRLPGRGGVARRGRAAHGAVVDSVNVRVFEYAPARSGVARGDRLLELQRDRVVGDRPRVGQERQRGGRDIARTRCSGSPRWSPAPSAPAAAPSVPLTRWPGAMRARVGHGQRRVAGRREDVGRRAGACRCSPRRGRTRRSRRARRASATASGHRGADRASEPSAGPRP